MGHHKRHTNSYRMRACYRLLLDSVIPKAYLERDSKKISSEGWHMKANFKLTDVIMFCVIWFGVPLFFGLTLFGYLYLTRGF